MESGLSALRQRSLAEQLLRVGIRLHHLIEIV
ncbi:MAG TPA: hypothetical protein DEB17_01375 [Chlorobaculum sp.]|uniref:Uncharacterized protein n=1 Tax=Chlorobaculum tepidum (strain ATCC 49652 / DSM 12025 / NBRC 103806 / TLS) TaxID=194439 RepID=Q8KCG1_CHLTE|nr:hypothetical protein CT1460 [Chlorobaculum tepidum TLS]HBU22650.1 hypothetical protein [Chlorobaculum sp.]